MNGTPKQIAWATDLKNQKINTIAANQNGKIGNDTHLTEIANFAIRKIASEKFEDVDQKRAEKKRLKSALNLSEMRGYIINQHESQNSAQWWIDNYENDMTEHFGTKYIKTI